MKKLKASYKIENKLYTFASNTKTFKGKNEVLLDDDDNLLQNVSFNDKGYKVVNFNKYFSHKLIKQHVENYIKNVIEKNFNQKIKNFNLEHYHKYIDQDAHIKILKIISKGIKFSKIISRRKLEKFISKILKIKVSTKNKKYKRKLNPNVFFIRIIRPSKHDFNPPHRDAYLNRLRSGVNIYIPICGSNKKSSLPIFPKSHKLKESKIERTNLNSSFNNLKFTVPTIIKTSPYLKLIRPNPRINQLLIFSPYLIHGGGINENKNTTRVSIELRFWRSN
jgi:hypothetical protein